MADVPNQQFHWADYVVFSLSLAIGVFVGILFAVKDKWLSQSAESYLMAERKMGWIPVGLSFWATVVSAGFFIGLTTEFYFFGTTIIWVVISRYIGASFTVLVVIPKFYRMGFSITSAYEMLSMSVTLYGPSLVLAKVSNIDLHWCIFIGGFVCLIYTAFVFIMTLGMCVLAGYGITKGGGMERVWQIYGKMGQRDNWDDVNAKPWDRHNVWNVLFLHAIMYVALFSTSQSVLQRYLTVPKMAMAQSTLSSAQNAMSAVLTEDFVQPIYKRLTRRELKEKSAGFISRMAGVVVGISVIALALIVPYFNDTLLSLSLSVASFFSGPVLGLLIVGFFFFWVESWGALIGLLCALSWGVMMYSGSMRLTDHVGREQKPLFMKNFTEIVTFPDADRAPTLFDVSYTWYVFLDVLVVLIVSSIVSLMVHCIRKGRLNRTLMFTDRNLIYTLDDLKAAVGYKHKEVINITPYLTSDDDAVTSSTRMDDVIRRSNGVENTAYEMDKY
ncbi:hypothetical protein LSH36_330g07013 [Paralvinella palmiformis]|uniref:Uncharacterized protein n=1 Tax=Paralvinella palmiformis TaxID=53620 RepID=A0AAD9JGM2_9ANNE|nr:hypothetical protein LSH36_330g07013 [Paralvinella palmiformis]